MTRVFLIAASGRERERWEGLLDAAGAEVVEWAAGLQNAAEEALEEADVVLLDASSEPLEELLEGLQARGLLRESRVVLCGGPPSFLWASQALRAGVRGLLARELRADQLKSALEAVVAGLLVLHPYELQLPGTAGAADEAFDFVESLTGREKEVLQMLARGRGNKEIAAALKISEHTVKFHVASILGKLGASSRTEAVSVALRRGLLLL